jgi:regulator of sigma E protease
MILTVILGIIGLGVMVFIHELGHFTAAKMSGVGVETFSLGWGPQLIGFTHKGTSYRISWLPIGGYCKMKGELAPGMAGGGAAEAREAAAKETAGARGDAAAPETRDAGAAGAAAVAAAPRYEKDSYLAASPMKRILISVFGPLFNLVFAAVIFTVIWWAGFNTYSSDNRVILATDYALDSFTQTPPATAAGLRTGDRVLAIDGAPVENFQDILEKVSTAPGKHLRLDVRRADGQAESLTLTPQLDRDSGTGRIGIYAWVDPVIASVAAGSASAIAGLRAGDRIVSVDGKPVAHTIALSQALKEKPSKAVVGFTRGGAEQEATLVFVYDDKGAVNLGLGFASTAYRSPRVGPGGAVVKSLEETWSTVVLTVKGIGLLFQGINLRNAVAGPLRITYYIGTAATSGFQMGLGAGLESFFRFLAFLSVVLFLMNLLPIPAMDGGQIILFAVEAVRGRPVRARIVWQIQIIGFTLLIGLTLFVTFSDILFFMGR